MLRVALILSLAVATPLSGDSRIVLLHFSDYHSHALPFYSEDRPDQGGVARAIHYLRREKARGAIVLSGGDTINKGSPAWSDKYRCAEWPWFNGIVDAMAFGNHDPDYGRDVFEDCRESVRYPILSANTDGMQRSVVLAAKGIRVGVFALAGSDFETLTKGFSYSDRIAAAREVVSDLRRRSDVVVMIGHETTEEDYVLARTVPGIDIIFGSHSHLKRSLTRIEGTDTWFVSPYQYLAYLTRLELTFDSHRRLMRVEGGLVRVDGRLGADRGVAKRVRHMQSELERDPVYASLFEPIGRLKGPLTVPALAARSVALMRFAVDADVALSTASSFRQPLPPGTIDMETLRAAMPYDNEIVVLRMSGRKLQELFGFGSVHEGSDNEVVVTPLQVEAERTYRVATTDYMARLSVYSGHFGGGIEKTGKRVRQLVREWIARASGEEAAAESTKWLAMSSDSGPASPQVRKPAGPSPTNRAILETETEKQEAGDFARPAGLRACGPFPPILRGH